MATTAEIREVVVSTVDVSELRTSIDELDVRYFNRNPPPTIHQIPIYVRKGNESAYTPTFVSIGPYHRKVHKDSYLHEQTKGMKILYLSNFLQRTGQDMETYASLIKSHEEEARDCYHDRCKGLESKEFVQMMVLDGCFIIELLLKFTERRLGLWLASKRQNWRDLRNDLMLMENQIPFFILKLIYDSSHLYYKVQGGVPRSIEILDLCLFFLHRGKITKATLEQTHGEDDIKNVSHILHLSYLCHMVEKIIPEMESPPETFRDRLIEKTKRVFYFIAYVFLFPIKWFLLLFFYVLIFLLEFIKMANKIMWQKPDMHKRPKVKAKEKRKPMIIPTATELNEFGVTFKRKKCAKNSIDVSFENGIMEIPQVRIDDSSNSKFRNYLALEQNCREVGNAFSSYVTFMDNLVDTTSDVALLKKSKIIVSLLGSDKEVAKFFNGLMVGSVFNFDNHYLENLFEEVRVHCNKDHNRWRAMLTRDYFSSPWSIVSLFGAFTLLAFSATQVVYAIKTSHGM